MDSTGRELGRKRMQLKVLLLIILLTLKSLYIPLNKRKSKHYWNIPLDSYIPLIPIFIIPYLLHHPGIIITGALLWNTQFCVPFLLSMIVSYALAVVFWYTVPNGVVRPPVIQSSVFSPLVKILYQHDGDTNGFPSAHIFVTLLCGYYLSYAFPLFIVPLWLCVSTVVLSVLFTKQHYIIDIPGGGIVAFISICLVKIIIPFIS